MRHLGPEDLAVLHHSSPPCTPSDPTCTAARSTLVLLTLFLGTFVLGTAELGVVGMLDLVAADMAVPVPVAGTLVSAYAVGLALGGPVLAALTIRFDKRVLLVAALGLYLAGTAAAVVWADFGTFVVARAATGALHGLFVGVAFTVAAAVVSPERVGRAMAAVVAGFAVSAALGLPAGTLLGTVLGWRASFLVFVVAGALCLVATIALVPPVAGSGAGDVRAQARSAFAPRVLAVLGLAFLIFAGQYAALTYVTAFLQDVTGVHGEAATLFLFVYGAATAVGVLGGGRFADRSAARTVIVADAVLVLALGALYLAGDVPAAAAVALMLWGLVGMGLVPSLQYRVAVLAGPGRDLAAALPASVINVGIAAGALVGGLAVSAAGPASVVALGAVLCLLALPVAIATRRSGPPPEPSAPADGATATATAPS